MHELLLTGHQSLLEEIDDSVTYQIVLEFA